MAILSKVKGKVKLIAFFGVLLGTVSCSQTAPEAYNKEAAAPELLHQASKQLTQVIVHDIFKPPVACRIYAYANLAAYETLREQAQEYPSMAGKLRGFAPVPAPEKGKAYCFPLASIKAFVAVGRKLTYSEEFWDAYEKQLDQKYKEMGIPEDVYVRSVSYGGQVASHVLAYAQEDNYKFTRNYRHELSHEAGAWQPTPPNYAEACEPKWSTIRSFTLDSCAQFAPPPPAPYDLTPGSPFSKLMQELYTSYGDKATAEQKEIAYFWDDNASVTNIKGHFSYLDKKMTPPGHWQAIITTIARNKKLDMMQSLQAYTWAAVAQHDAFIASWEEKYHSDRIRPVTAINQELDEEWEPFLETPPFPEYVSAHSAISAAAGRILIHLLGDQVAFTDSTEYEFGHGVRSFSSIKDAYMETSLSRVYGGIHFRDGAMEGTAQGERVGEWVWAKLAGTPSEKPNPNLVAGK